jgi:hypothetical protein
MKAFTNEELKVILEKHYKHLRFEWDGEIANLSRANLSRVDLSGANLSGANLSGANLSRAIGDAIYIKSIFLDAYPITYTSDILQIGCQSHPISEWREFRTNQIRHMDGQEAVDFWTKYKDFIFKAIEISPALPTGAGK